MLKSELKLWLAFFLVSFLFGCGSGGKITTPPPPTTSVSISPTSVNVNIGTQQQFTAQVSGSTNTAVTWQVNGVIGGDASVGTISTAGLFAAPVSATSKSTVSVTATAQADPTKSASSSVTIVPVVGIAISPVGAVLAASGQQQYTAAVSNTLNTSVIWQVNSVTGGSATLGTISATGLYTAPAAATNPTITAQSVADPTKSATTSVTVLAAHPAGTRANASGFAEFFDRASGNTIFPRGSNYVRLATLTDPNGNSLLGHSTFNVGAYDSAHAEAALSAMQAAGFNIVTVTLQGCCANTIGNPSGGLSSTYIANTVDFLQRAKKHSVAVVFASSWLPVFGGFSEMMGPCYPQFNDINLTNLSSCGVKAFTTFYQDFVQGLISAQAPMDAIFAYEIWDEYYYNANFGPVSATSGTVTTANGQTYDMSSAMSKQQMMDDGLVYFADQARTAILALDPTALVTMSFFLPESPNPIRVGDPRIIEIYPAISTSTLDYVDLHAYPGSGLTLDQSVQNFGFVGYLQQKPILMGEMGAFISSYPQVTDAAAALQAWQIQSCGYNFQGWLIWTWDTDEQPELWNAMSQSGVISQALSPVARPNPCSP